MIDSLKDPKVIIGILAIINTLVLALVFQWWRNRKGLSCEIVSDIPLFSVRYEIKHRVEVLLDGKPVENVHLVIMKVVNTGRVPIDEKDFIIPIGVSFGETSEILTTEITQTSPSDLPAKIIPEKQRVTIEPLMLNRADTITIKILVSKLSNPIRIAGRVRGVAQLKKHGTVDDSRDDTRGCLYGGVIVIGWMLLYIPLQLLADKLSSLERLGVWGNTLSIILFLILVFLWILVPAHLLQRVAEKELDKLNKRLKR